MSVLNDPDLEKLLERLHAQSSAQNEAVTGYFVTRAREGSLDWKGFDEGTHRFMADKLIALERDKAELCYQLCRALRARRIVEVGTSFGVSTLYLAAAVRDNAREDGERPSEGRPERGQQAAAPRAVTRSGTKSIGTGVVIGTEYEPAKARAARANWQEAGLTEWIELREGDLRETLRGLAGPIDFVLMDIWVEMARPALERILPALRPGAIVVADNTNQFREPYADYFALVNDPKSGLRTVTLPYEGGLELTVKV
ncbi:MAG TPA: class I SAM-dependent methyltransferase [Myxococcota bacterium]|nr:class I SAM-dependent methyltransferase [Myxococcota bacterium]